MSWITPTTLDGATIRLEPLREAHAGDLFVAAQSEETFQYFSRSPRPWSVDGFRAFIRFLLDQPDVVAFCVIAKATGTPVGATTYLDIRPAHEACEIGWTWYAPSHRGGRTNPEAKRVLLGHAFDALRAHRVQLRTDLRNLHSQRAIEKLGAKKEGVFRENTLMMDGYRRSTVYYSILAPEWPAVRDALDRRLAALEHAPQRA